MVNLTEAIPALADVPIIGILRRCPPNRLLDVAAVAQECGLITLEITLDSVNPLAQISSLKRTFPDLTVGAGTVLSARGVEVALDAGASFVVSPVLVPDVITACAEAAVPSLPGAATPTEIWSALQLGAAGVKIFPARQLGGPAYISALRQPLRDIPMVPTGGVDPGDVAAYLDAGAVAVALGGSIFPSTQLEGDLSQVAKLVTSAVKATK